MLKNLRIQKNPSLIIYKHWLIMPNITNAKIVSTIAIFLATAILTACGGGGGGESTPPTTPVAVDPDPSGLGVNSAGFYADARGFYPDAAGRYPDSRGLYPNASGIYPTNAEAGIFTNDQGTARSYSTLGAIDTTNPFFKSFGSGRTCASCHVQGEGFSITPAGLEDRFVKTNGTDPVFQLNDGANSPNAPVATLADKRAAYSMLLKKGLIRVEMPVPAGAEFVVDSVVDPYGYATPTRLSLFRRPLPSANLRFLASVMWDSRETIEIPYNPTGPDPKGYCLNLTRTPPSPCFAPFSDALKMQANNATLGHAQAATALTALEQKAIVDFELTLFTAQQYDNSAGFLASGNAKGGTNELTTVNYYFEINSVFNDPITGGKTTIPATGATPADGTKFRVMQLFGAWATNPGTKDATTQAVRASIARGEKLFNTRTFTMTNVAGTAVNPVLNATCTNCHSTPQVGSLSQPNLFNIGVSDGANRTSDMPLYTLRKISTSGAPVGTTVTTTDPGRAMVTGKWLDIGKFKVSALRGLAMRPPYFHDGSAKTIEDTTAFYNTRFNMNLTAQESADLNAFLKSL